MMKKLVLITATLALFSHQAFAASGWMTGDTNVKLLSPVGIGTGSTIQITPPSASGTLATLAGTETFSNKTLGLASGTSGAQPLYFSADTGTSAYNKGFNSWSFYAHGVEVLDLLTYGNGVNYVGIQAGSTGINPSIQALGADTNVNLSLNPKGTGSVYANGSFTSAGVSTFVPDGTAGAPSLVFGSTEGLIHTTSNHSLTFIAQNQPAFQVLTFGTTATNYIAVQGNTAGNAPTIQALGTDTNVGLVLTPKGTGVVATGAGVSLGSTLSISGVTTATGQINLPTDGSASTPNLIFGSSTDGLYHTSGNHSETFVAQGQPAFQVLTFGTSAANYIAVQGNVAGSSPSIQALGTDTNVGIALTPKGTGIVYDNGGLTTVGPAIIGSSLTVANGATVSAGSTTITGGVLNLSTDGTLTAPNINFGVEGLFHTTGSHTLTFEAQGAPSFAIQTFGATAQNYLAVQGNVNGSGPTLKVVSNDSETNVGLTLSPLGTGVVYDGSGLTVAGTTTAAAINASGIISSAHTTGNGFAFGATDTFTNNGVTSFNYGLTINSPVANDVLIAGYDAVTIGVGAAQKGTWTTTGLAVNLGTTRPMNALDVGGGLALGSYAGVNSAGSGNVIAPGTVGIGTTVITGKITNAGNYSGARVTVADAAYSATCANDLIAYTSITAARTVTMPTNCGSSTQPIGYTVKDESNAASGTNTITIAGVTIDGVSNKQITTPSGFLHFYCIGTASCFTFSGF